MVISKTSTKQVKTGVFIDGSNMLWGSKESGIKVDWQKMHGHLREKYNPDIFNFFGCEDLDPDEKHKRAAQKQQEFYTKLTEIGYQVKRKALKKYKSGGTKCDMDLELVMAMRKYENDFDRFVIFTGDSDFLPVIKYYWQAGKQLTIYSFQELLSWELKLFTINHTGCNYHLINKIKIEIERK